jgi:hypothetical protein
VPMNRFRLPLRRTHPVRWHGVTFACYRATQAAWRATWRRDRLDVRAMDEAAHEALEWLGELVDMRVDDDAREARRWLRGVVDGHWLVKA